MRTLWLLALVTGCTSAQPTKTGTTCADPDPITGTTTLTWQNFGYDRPLDSDEPANLIGSLQVAYGTPTRYEITIYRVTVTGFGTERGWTVASLCDEALQFGGLTLEACPRAELGAPPKPFRFTSE